MGVELLKIEPLPSQAMSEEQLSALLAKLRDDAGLREKLKGAADLEAAVALAKEAGFDVSKGDWLRYQAKLTLELSDEELEGRSGGTGSATDDFTSELCCSDPNEWHTANPYKCTAYRYCYE